MWAATPRIIGGKQYLLDRPNLFGRLTFRMDVDTIPFGRIACGHDMFLTSFLFFSHEHCQTEEKTLKNFTKS